MLTNMTQKFLRLISHQMNLLLVLWRNLFQNIILLFLYYWIGMERKQQNFAVITIPTTYIVDRNGIIMKRIVGPMSKEQMIELASSIK